MSKQTNQENPHRATIRLPGVEVSGSGYGLLVVCFALVGAFVSKAYGLW